MYYGYDNLTQSHPFRIFILKRGGLCRASRRYRYFIMLIIWSLLHIIGRGPGTWYMNTITLTFIFERWVLIGVPRLIIASETPWNCAP